MTIMSETGGCTVSAAGWHEFPCEDPLTQEYVLPDAVWLRSADRVGSMT